MRKRQARFGAVAFLFLSALVFVSMPALRAEQSLGDKLKHIFEPTPTPAPKKKKSSSAKKKPSPSPTPAESPSASPLAKKKTSPSPSPKHRASPSASPKEGSEGDSPSPKRKHSPSPNEGDDEASPATTPRKKHSASPTPSAKSKKKSSPSPSPSPEEESPSPSPEESPSPSPNEKKDRATGVTISTGEIAGFEQYPAAVQKLIANSLELASRNLSYKYGSADPSSGGMDCSGFVYYVLRQNGLTDVPRDSSAQYVWVRKSGKFEAVVGKSDDTFELANLKPGDLLFWTGTYEINRDPPVTHAMIYLGKEKGTGRRIMVGSSDGRTYHDQSRYGVSVFDFRVSRPGHVAPSGRTPDFVGYGKIPGLGDG